MAIKTLGNTLKIIVGRVSRNAGNFSQNKRFEYL
jgi:hypothetical protein